MSCHVAPDLTSSLRRQDYSMWRHSERNTSHRNERLHRVYGPFSPSPTSHYQPNPATRLRAISQSIAEVLCRPTDCKVNPLHAFGTPHACAWSRSCAHCYSVRARDISGSYTDLSRRPLPVSRQIIKLCFQQVFSKSYKMIAVKFTFRLAGSLVMVVWMSMLEHRSWGTSRDHVFAHMSSAKDILFHARDPKRRRMLKLLQVLIQGT